MGWQEYNGGDETSIVHLVLLFIIFIGMIIFFWFFGPETKQMIPDTGE